MSFYLVWIAIILITVLERIPQLQTESIRFNLPTLKTNAVYVFSSGFIAMGVNLIIIGIEGKLPTYPSGNFLGLNLPYWMVVLIAVVLLDLVIYLAHYLFHKIEFLWSLHKIHHSNLNLEAIATFRSHFLAQSLLRLSSPIFLVFLGFSQSEVLWAGGIFNVWALVNHANLNFDLRFLETVFITPRLHRIHHRQSTSERNLGTIFVLWDQVFRRLEKQEPVNEAFGVPFEVESFPQNSKDQFLQPFKELRSQKH